MTGIQFVTDEKGKRVAVQIDLAIHGELWEDLQDVLDSRERDSEQSVPFGEFKAQLVKTGKLNEGV
jgi:hypothetical protein